MKTLMYAVMLSLGGMTWVPRLAEAKPGDIHVAIMAAKLDWASPEFGGYAFVCFTEDLTEGAKDECYAFYPKAEGRGFVGGPGTTSAEFRKQPLRFPTGVISITRTVTGAQRTAVMKAIDAWDEKEYPLSSTSCIELVRDLAQLSGFFVPPRKNEKPDAFVRRLQVFNGTR